MSARRRPPGGYARDSLEIEGYLRGMGRRRPDISVGILRLAPLIGPQLTATVGHYVTAPLVPTIVGRNARLQLLHVEDASRRWRRRPSDTLRVRTTSPATEWS